ncbi:MAG: glutathione S-transferase N-terminal domain-containing protein [Prochloraceae cyanobacterium]|nr:glutathione S-transferase N-terminal domain-containing protein [Prochloraceae cyanobacterium]
MITLFGLGSKFGLPDPSPFVMKVDLLLKMAGLDYKTNTEGNLIKADLMKTPKGKFPYIEDDGIKLGDSTLIKYYLENKYSVDFEKNLDLSQKATLFFAEKHCEDHLYFLLMADRWLNESNFEKGPKAFFEKAPAFKRFDIEYQAKQEIKKMLWLQGLGRHSREEQVVLVSKSSEMLAVLLGDRPYFGGDEPCGYDATLFSFISGMTIDLFESPFRPLFLSKSNLIEYRNRMMTRYYPEFAKKNNHG